MTEIPATLDAAVRHAINLHAVERGRAPTLGRLARRFGWKLRD